MVSAAGVRRDCLSEHRPIGARERAPIDADRYT
jgi:hypothetical protein